MYNLRSLILLVIFIMLVTFVSIPNSRASICDGTSCTPGDTSSCTDAYGCTGTQTCDSSETWGGCSAQESTVPVCTGTPTDCSTLPGDSTCTQQQGCSIGPYICTGSPYYCSYYSDTDVCCLGNAPAGCSAKRSGENCYCVGTPAACSTYVSSSSCATYGCSWAKSCIGTATDCSSLPSTCINSQGIVQPGCTTGDVVVCGTPTSTTKPSGTTTTKPSGTTTTTTLSCDNAPTVNLNPTSQRGTAGQTLTYTFSVKNPDASGCGSADYNLTKRCPSGWTCTLNKNSVTVSLGATDSTTTLHVTPPSSASGGTYTVSATATNMVSSKSASDSSTYVISVCNSNGKCEQKSNPSFPMYNASISQDETQINCPHDCFTTVSISPSQSSPNQIVTLTFTFNDSTYYAGETASYSITIDGKTWDSSNGCDIANVNVTPSSQYNGACTWQKGGLTNSCTSISVNGFLSVITNCTIPSDIQAGSHQLQVIPTIY